MSTELIKIIGVGDMLVDIAQGLGFAHHRLWETSNTPIGTLAVKDAEIKVDFEMSSNGSDRTADATLPCPLPILGAKTFSLGTTSNESKQSNRTTLTLRIVNVMPEKEDAELLKLLLMGVVTGFGQLKLNKDQQSKLAEAVARISGLINAGKLGDARAALDVLVAHYEQLKTDLTPSQLGGHVGPATTPEH